MRRLHTSRAFDADRTSYEGYDAVILEGDLRRVTPDAGSSLRPFGRDFPEPALGMIETGSASDEAALLQRVGILSSQGRRLDAVLLLRQFLEEHPSGRRVRIALATLLDQGGEPEAAIEQLTMVLASGTDVEALVQRGALHAQVGQAALAEADLRSALARDASHCVASLCLGQVLLRRGVFGEALGPLRNADRLAPNNAETKLALGEALAATGRVEEALAVLRRASELAPRDPRPYTHMGRLLDRLGRTDEAMGMHRKAREVAGR